MFAPSLGHARWAFVLLVCALLPIACGGGDDAGSSGETQPGGPNGPAGACEVGQHRSADGSKCVDAGWTACPEGFHESVDGCRAVVPAAVCADGESPRLGSTRCEPHPKNTCAVGFVQDGAGCKEVLPAARCTGATRDELGAVVCVPLGDCAQEVKGATHFVDHAFNGAQLDETHFATLSAAVLAAPDGAIIAVASGTYKETLAISRSVVIAGRCAANVIVDGESTPGRYFASVNGNIDVEFRGLTVRNYESAVRTGKGSRTKVVDTLFEANTGNALAATDKGTVATVERTVVRGTLPWSKSTEALRVTGSASMVVRSTSLVGNFDKAIASTLATVSVTSSLIANTETDNSGTFGNGLVVISSQATVSQCAFVANHSDSVYSDSKLTLSDSVVRGTLPDKKGTYGRGITLAKGTTSMSNVTFDQNRDVSVSLEAKAKLDAKQLIIRDSKANARDGLGIGITALSGSVATVDGSLVLRAQESGIRASGAGSKITLSNSVIASTQAGAPEGSSEAAFAGAGGELTLDHCAVLDSAEAGVTVAGAGSLATLTQTIVDSTRSNEEGLAGFGARAVGGGRLVVNGGAFLRNRDEGILITEAGSSAELSSIEVSGTIPAESGTQRGRGIEVNKGAVALVKGAALVNNVQLGIFVSSEDSSLDLTDAYVARVQPTAENRAGRGFTAQSGAKAHIANVAFIDDSEMGVSAIDRSTLEIVDSVVRATHKADDAFGYGVFGTDSAVSLTGCRIEGSESSGLGFRGARVAVSGSVVANNAIGVFVDKGSQLQEVPKATLPTEPGLVLISSDTKFIGNTTRVGGGSLPVAAVLD